MMSSLDRRISRPALAATFAAALIGVSAPSVVVAQADPSPAGASSQAGPDCPGMTTDPITITYWDSANENLSDDGIATIDGEFMAKYPNVKIVRVGKAFGDILATA